MACDGEVKLDDKTMPGFIIVTCPRCGMHDTYLQK